MDVTRIISKLHAERDEFEQTIFVLERRDQLNTGTTQATGPFVIQIERIEKPEKDRKETGLRKRRTRAMRSA